MLVIGGWILILLYMSVILFFVIRGALKIKSMEDYAVGNITFSPIAVGLSLAASITSAATFIINPGFIAMFGLSGVVCFAIVLPAAALSSLVVFTKGFRKYGTAINATTMAQWMGARYKSPKFSLFFAFLSLLLLTFIVLICVGLTKVISKTLNLSEFSVLIAIVVFIFGYMMFGGANSMVYTNTIQAVIMLVVAFILLGSGYEHFSNGVHEFLGKLKTINPNLVSWTNPESPIFRDYFEIVFCPFIVGIAIICQPHIITKSLLLKSDSDINKYLITGLVAELIFFLVVIAGLYARLSFPDLTWNGKALGMDDILPVYVVKEFPVFIALIITMGLISAGLSTLEGLIQSLSATITVDIIVPLFGKNFPREKMGRIQILINRFVIVILGGLAILFSYQQIVNPSLSVGIFAQNGVYAYFAAAFVPVLFGTFIKDIPRVAVITAAVSAVVIHFYIYYVGIFPGITQYMWHYNANNEYVLLPVRNPAIAATMAILGSTLVGIVMMLFTRNRSE